jgi:hypothetical protein
MPTFIRSAAYAAAQNLSGQVQLPVKRSHLNEVIAALLGYRTYAALVAEETDATREYYLEDAEILILDRAGGLGRAKELYREASDELAQTLTSACERALKSCGPRDHVFIGVDEFYDRYAREAIADAISYSSDAASAMAETNAYFPNEPYMPIECPVTEEVWSAREEWRISADGDWVGKYDSDGDRPFTGNTLNCRGMLIYTKAGRAGLIFHDSEATGGVDETWRDEDREAEGRYFASLGSM